MSKNLSTAMALSAAALFLAACQKDAPPTSPPGGDTAAPSTDAVPGGDVAGEEAAAKNIKCFGVNSCKSEGKCDVPDGRVEEGSKGHACGGQNDCKGKGWVLLTADDCTAQGGEPL